MPAQLHWGLRWLGFVVISSYLAIQRNGISSQDFCHSPTTPPALFAISTWAAICHPVTILTKTSIPVVLTSREVAGLAPMTLQLPNPIEMIKNRIEIGKISATLAAIGTPEAQMMMDAVENYDQKAENTIRSLARLSAQSTLAHKSLIGILSGIIDALINFPKDEKRVEVVRDMIQSRQAKIDAWVLGFQDALSELFVQAQEALHDLDATGLHLKQVVLTSGRSKGQQERVAAEGIPDSGWANIIFGGAEGSVNLRPPVLEAISNLEALIEQSSQARGVVLRLSYDVERLSTGIKAARNYPNGMLTVEMTLDSEVEVMVNLLRKLRGEAESESISSESE